jgi:hypothetical protein
MGSARDDAGSSGYGVVRAVATVISAALAARFTAQIDGCRRPLDGFGGRWRNRYPLKFRRVPPTINQHFTREMCALIRA